MMRALQSGVHALGLHRNDRRRRKLLVWRRDHGGVLLLLLRLERTCCLHVTARCVPQVRVEAHVSVSGTCFVCTLNCDVMAAEWKVALNGPRVGEGRMRERMGQVFVVR